MTAYHQDDRVTVWHGDCLEVMPTLADASVDAVVTDPPYGLEFMGREWDGANGFRRSLNGADVGRESVFGRASRTSPEYRAGRLFGEWCEAWATECQRVLKPGGHLLAFGGTRTWHRLVCAVEDAGFEIRDSIAWLYGSGFPKSLDVSKAIDRAAGAEREITGPPLRHGGGTNGVYAQDAWTVTNQATMGAQTVPATDAARQWQGWGTALKPAHEPVVVARKPLAGTVAGNVLAHGTGALNIDGCRIGSESTRRPMGRLTSKGLPGGGYGHPDAVRPIVGDSGSESGRWPANVVLDESQAETLDQQSGELTSGAFTRPEGRLHGFMEDRQSTRSDSGAAWAADQGGASRFFYTAKAGSDERITHNGTAHPTVKPLSLMRWLVRLVTPPAGLILEPFAGSGTTVEAALLEGFGCIAIEREPDYLPLITQRINRRRDPVAYLTTAGEDLGLFDGAAS